jgi:hypothetical protein
MNELVDSKKNPELVMSGRSPALLLIVVHLEPIHVVVDNELSY